jgi:hypothetical protein
MRERRYSFRDDAIYHAMNLKKTGSDQSRHDGRLTRFASEPDKSGVMICLITPRGAGKQVLWSFVTPMEKSLERLRCLGF